jgi:hypothetical protein
MGQALKLTIESTNKKMDARKEKRGRMARTEMPPDGPLQAYEGLSGQVAHLSGRFSVRD